MGIFDNIDDIFELGSKEFYAPLFGPSRRRAKKEKAVPIEHRIAPYRLRLVELRRAAGVRQQTMASEMGSSQSSISRFESGWGNPTVEFLIRYCNVINIEIGLVFKSSPEKSS
ncbi:MAG: helix-turn-helix transcriptional regulator [bacterium]|nr:helix-turn-helix transcriptional regulator [bacterium]